MPGPGDLVTVLSLDDFEFRTGLRNASTETRKFAADVTQAGQKASGNFGRGISQMGFALQDFSSVVSMGGKNALGRAIMSTMNNVQMLGMAFGPWGLAITSVAGALGSILIPKLLEGEQAGDDFAKSIEHANKALDDLITKQVGGLKFHRGLADLKESGSVEDVRKAQRQNAGELEDLDFELNQRKAAFRRGVEGARDAGLLSRIPRGAGIGDDMMNRFIAGKAGGGQELELNPGGEKTAEELEAQRRKIIDIEDSIARRRRRGAALADILPNAAENDAFKDQAKENEKNLREIEQIRKRGLTPMGKLTEGLGDLSTLNAKMPGFEGVIAGGMESLFDEFARSLPHGAVGKLAAAAQFGSAEATSIVNRAVAQGEAGNERKEQLKEARRQTDLAKQQLDKLGKIEEGIAKNQPVNLNGG